MARIDDIGKQIADSLPKQDVDYIEVHLEEAQSNTITYRGKKLESINKGSSTGGNVRALSKYLK